MSHHIHEDSHELINDLVCQIATGPDHEMMEIPRGFMVSLLNRVEAAEARADKAELIAQKALLMANVFGCADPEMLEA